MNSEEEKVLIESLDNLFERIDKLEEGMTKVERNIVSITEILNLVRLQHQ